LIPHLLSSNFYTFLPCQATTYEEERPEWNAFLRYRLGFLPYLPFYFDYISYGREWWLDGGKATN